MPIDFRVDTRLPRHWKYKKLKRLIGESPMEYLIIFWGTVAEQIPNGALNGWSNDDIESAAEWGGENGVFCSAMVESRLLDITNDGFSPHDWAENQPWVFKAKERSQAAKKAGKASASARRKKAGTAQPQPQKPTDTERGVREPFRTPSPSPSPLTTPYQERTYKDLGEVTVNTATGEVINPDGECPF